MVPANNSGIASTGNLERLSQNEKGWRYLGQWLGSIPNTDNAYAVTIKKCCGYEHYFVIG